MRFPDSIENWTETIDTRVGRFSIAWSRKGLLALALPGHDPVLFAARWRARAEGANTTVPAGEAPRDAADQARAFIMAFVDGRPLPEIASVPLDLEVGGTEFELAVWRAIAAVPLGATRSYGQVAVAIDNPDSARAVGRACGQNPIPLIVPCHRITGSSGELSGFSAPGGPVVKSRLLSWERTRSAAAPSTAVKPTDDIFAATSTSGRHAVIPLGS